MLVRGIKKEKNGIKIKKRLNWDSSSAPGMHLFIKVTTATAVASSLQTLFTLHVYTAGGLRRLRLNYDKKCATAICPITWKHNIIRRTIVHNVLHCRQWRTEPWPQLTCTENFMKFGCVTWEQCYVMQKSCPQLFWTNEGLAPTGLLLKVTGIEIRFSLLVQSLAQKTSLILSRWSSGTTTANECAVQYWL